MSDTNQKELQKKTVSLGNRQVTLYSLDGMTWSSKPEELEEIVERRETGKAPVKGKGEDGKPSHRSPFGRFRGRRPQGRAKGDGGGEEDLLYDTVADDLEEVAFEDGASLGEEGVDEEIAAEIEGEDEAPRRPQAMKAAKKGKVSSLGASVESENGLGTSRSKKPVKGSKVKGRGSDSRTFSANDGDRKMTEETTPVAAPVATKTVKKAPKAKKPAAKKAAVKKAVAKKSPAKKAAKKSPAKAKKAPAKAKKAAPKKPAAKKSVKKAAPKKAKKPAAKKTVAKKAVKKATKKPAAKKAKK